MRELYRTQDGSEQFKKLEGRMSDEKRETMQAAIKRVRRLDYFENTCALAVVRDVTACVRRLAKFDPDGAASLAADAGFLFSNLEEAKREITEMEVILAEPYEAQPTALSRALQRIEDSGTYNAATLSVLTDSFENVSYLPQTSVSARLDAVIGELDAHVAEILAVRKAIECERAARLAARGVQTARAMQKAQVGKPGKPVRSIERTEGVSPAMTALAL